MSDESTPPVPTLVQEIFTYHPATEEQRPKYKAVREAAMHLAATILDSCPPSADRTAAIRKVREAVMTANASIALDGLAIS